MVNRRLLLLLLLPACTDPTPITDVDLMAAPQDFSVARDLRKPNDLSVPPDLSVQPDLSAIPDLSVLEDLSVSEDLTALPDLAVSPSPTPTPSPAPPIITQVSPSPCAVGSALTVTGTNLGGTTLVKLDGLTQSFDNNTALSLRIPSVSASPSPSPVPLVVTTPVGVSNAFGVTIIDRLSISSITATSATTVQVTFSRALNGATVTKEDFAVTGLSISAALTASNVVTLTTSSQTPAFSYGLDLVGPVADTFGNPLSGVSTPFTGFGLPLPNITQVSPAPVPLGAPLTVTGTHLDSASLVTFGGQSQSFDNNTALSLHIPSVSGTPNNATPQPLIITTPAGASNSFNVILLDALSISSVVATNATTVEVTFSRTLAGATVVKEDFSITGLSISSAVTAGNLVTLTTSAQTPAFGYDLDLIGAVADTLGGPLTGVSKPFSGFGLPPPIVTAASPNPCVVGATLTVTGTNLGGATLVTLDSQSQSFDNNTATSLRIASVGVSPSPSPMPLQVTTPWGSSNLFDVTIIDGLSISSVVATSATTVEVTFSRTLDNSTVVKEDFFIAGLSISDAVTVDNVVTLATSTQTAAFGYDLDLIGSVSDNFGNPLSGATKPFIGFGVPPPVLVQLTPLTVVRGISSLIIDGSGFETPLNVTIGGVPQTVNSGNLTQLTIDTIDAATQPSPASPVVVSNANGSSNSLDLEVLERLQIASATATSPWEVQVTFNRAVDGGSVSKDRFAIPPLSILAANANGAVVTLTTTGQTAGTLYTVSVDSLLLDTLGTPADGTTADFFGSLPTEFVVARAGDGVTALSGNTAPVILQRRFISNGALVPSVSPLPMPSASPSPILLNFSGSQSAEGALSRSQDGKSLSLYGYNVALNLPVGTTPKAVGVVTWAAFADSSLVNVTTLTGTVNSTSARSAARDGNNVWVVGSTSNVSYTTIGTTTSISIGTTPAAGRVIRVFDNTLYFTIGGNSGSVYRMGTEGVLPTTAGNTPTPLYPSPGPIPNQPSPYSFSFIDHDAGETGFDVLYVGDDRTTPNGGGIQRYKKVSGTWQTTPEATLGPSIRQIACFKDGNDAQCIAASGTAIFWVRDTGCAKVTNATALTQIVGTPPANTAYRGLELAPVP